MSPCEIGHSAAGDGLGDIAEDDAADGGGVVVNDPCTVGEAEGTREGETLDAEDDWAALEGDDADDSGAGDSEAGDACIDGCAEKLAAGTAGGMLSAIGGCGRVPTISPVRSSIIGSAYGNR